MSVPLLNAIPRSLKIHVQAMQAWHRGEPELHLLPTLCDARAGAIDVGANRGVYTYFFQRYSRKVWAIEANPVYAAMVRDTFGKKVVVIEAAASNCAGRITLWIPKDKITQGMATVEESNLISLDNYVSVEVPCITIDSLVDEKIGIIKIDVEGHELAVLEGARALLVRDTPTLLVEVEDRHRADAVSSVCAFLQGLDYEGLFLLDGRLQPVDRFDSATYQNSDNLVRDRRVRSRAPYINNLIFISKYNRTAHEKIQPWLAT